MRVATRLGIYNQFRLIPIGSDEITLTIRPTRSFLESSKIREFRCARDLHSIAIYRRVPIQILELDYER